jgi:hypothetical protein
MDNGYSNVFEMSGGFDAWDKAGYATAGSGVIPAALLTKVTGPFTLIAGDTEGTPIPYGSVITHWGNGVTEVTKPDNTRIVVAKDSEAAAITTSTGEVKPVTWLYRLPDGATMAPNSEPGITKFLLNGNIILTVINNRADFTE